MSYKVDNAIIMAAGTASRFAPLSYEIPKALIEVKGEVLIERQIVQLREAKIPQIIVVVGYKKDQFEYLRDKYGVILLENKEYLTRNNNGSIYAVKEYLGNSYICSADNYFSQNPFKREEEESYYAAVFAEGETREWCIREDSSGYINHVQIGGENEWYMLGHCFWSREFSDRFVRILENEYKLPEIKDLLWEGIFCKHLSELKMKIQRYPADYIFEFDTLDELRLFDIRYKEQTNSRILQEICNMLEGEEKEICNIKAINNLDNRAEGFCFEFRGQRYSYNYIEGIIQEL